MTTDEEIVKTELLKYNLYTMGMNIAKQARQDEAKKIFALADGEPNNNDSPVRKVSKHSGIDTQTIKAVVAALKKECGVE